MFVSIKINERDWRGDRRKIGSSIMCFKGYNDKIEHNSKLVFVPFRKQCYFLYKFINIIC